MADRAGGGITAHDEDAKFMAAVEEVERKRSAEEIRSEREMEAAFVAATERAEIDMEIRKLELGGPDGKTQERLKRLKGMPPDWQRMFLNDLTYMDEFIPSKVRASKPTKVIKKATIRFKKSKQRLVTPFQLDEKKRTIRNGVAEAACLESLSKKFDVTREVRPEVGDPGPEMKEEVELGEKRSEKCYDRPQTTSAGRHFKY